VRRAELLSGKFGRFARREIVEAEESENFGDGVVAIGIWRREMPNSMFCFAER